MSDEENAVANAEPIASEALRKALNEAVRVEASGGHTILYHGHVPANTSVTCDSRLPSGAYVARFHADGVEFGPVELTPKPYQPSFTFPTEQSLRDFVKKCVDEHLDELAREMRENTALQPGTWRKEIE